MSISIKDILETISETRDALISDYINANDKDNDYEPSTKELLKHIVFLHKENTQKDLLDEIGALDSCDEDLYAALLLVAAASMEDV
jgi:hypothetical protein